ncbi:SAM-dependent methyltransferase [Streptomyces albus subsp. chlorinus]|uniref:SAM-dependent methyltransferase n=1 Tax=Streptomyces albus TaxID=1888 RepID=UPI00156D9026|nr:SAM-dependent methyltransferase [Streptomyces albus]NSC24670.1 SAM-dependent methyltransferase [Streptomyces albus subsp. chlorinus]
MSHQMPEKPVGTKPHTARMYDYYLGGKTNYGPDRQVAGQTLAVYPNALVAARENREFMHRAVRYLAREQGITQFLDIGTGIPSTPNLHQVAQREDPACRVVYADNDPIVLTYARALMKGTPEGATDYIEADVRDPERILDRARKTLDFARPIALSLIALLHFLGDDDDPHGIARTLLAALPPGSALALSHATDELDPTLHRVVEVYGQQDITVRLRGAEEIRKLFADTGLTLVEPGVVATCEWHPEMEDKQDGMRRPPGSISPSEVGCWAAVGIKAADRAEG